MLNNSAELLASVETPCYIYVVNNASEAKMKHTYSILVCLLILFIMGYVGTKDAQDAELDAQNYCAMVKLNRAHPEQGWPDYEGIYDKECR